MVLIFKQYREDPRMYVPIRYLVKVQTFRLKLIQILPIIKSDFFSLPVFKSTTHLVSNFYLHQHLRRKSSSWIKLKIGLYIDPLARLPWHFAMT